jgi:DNA mismatch repair protein MutS2
MPFPAGARVVVLTFGSKRGTVVQAGGGGRYRVQVEGATISCREEDLAAPAPAPAPKNAARKRAVGTPPVPDADSAPAGRVDLHGLGVDEAVERVTQAIDLALRRGAGRVEVVHGKGSGRVKQAVHRHLASLPVVDTFALDPRNTGVTWVRLR